MDAPETPPRPAPSPLLWAAALTALATAVRVVWVLAVPTVPVGDFAMYRESANYLSEFGRLDPGFIYMPGFVYLLALIKDLGGDLLAQKMIGVALGGLGAAGVFGVTYNLFDRAPNATRSRPTTAIVATAAYALWPAGVAMSSVVGTDVPAAALMLLALAALTGWAALRPYRAALAFGVVMGLAAYVRAVALPLTALSAFFWLARRRRPLDVVKLTALSVAATLVVLLPWAVRNARHDGELFFTDSHGGITALIGANPNSEGTYTRALNQMFKETTGRSVLDEPHRQVDRLAYGMAVEWTRFAPAYALGLALKRAGRLFDIERRLLYWPITRPGVLIPPHSRWWEARRDALDRFADRYWTILVALFLAGLALAVAEGRAVALTLLPFQAALAATYILFFAEPRYRIPIEMMAFPVAAFALVGLARLGRRAVQRDRRALRVAIGAVTLGVLLIGGVFLLAPATMNAGATLRSRHRWAVALWTVDGQRPVSLWRRSEADLRQNAAAPSPLEGALDGVRLRAYGGPGNLTQANVRLSGAPLAAGRYSLTGDVEVTPSAVPSPSPSPSLTVRFEAPAAPGAGPAATVPAVTLPAGTRSATLSGELHHQGGPLSFTVSLQVDAAPGVPPVDVWISNVKVDRLSASPGP